MKPARIVQGLILLVHALVGWGLCGSIIAIGRTVTTMDSTLIAHAIGVPIIFSAVTRVYFRWFRYTTPRQTALAFVGTALLMDGGVIAPFLEKSFAMFASPLGTWIPLVLIFASTYLTGSYVTQRATARAM
jgi:hypothetical protein